MVLRARDLFEADLDPVLPPDQPDDFEADDALFSAKEVAMAGKGMVAFPGIHRSYAHGASISPWLRLERLYGRGGRSTWGGLPAKTVDNNTSVVDFGRDDAGDRTFGLLLHDTIIAKISPDKAVYSTGGWHTRTTVERINRVLFGGWNLSVLKGTLYWYNWEAKQGVMGSECRIPFTDGDSINLRTGTLTINGTAEPWPVRRRRKVLPEGHKAGVYADLTGDKADYYVKCPKCGSVSGTFKSKREAELNSTCGSCLFDEREATRRRLEKEGRPKKAKSRAESMTARLLEDEDDLGGFNAKQHAIENGPTWADRLKVQLEVKTRGRYEYALADQAQDPGSRVFLIDSQRKEPAFLLYRDTDAMRGDAFNTVYEALADNPSAFTTALLERLIDFSTLRNLLQMDEHTRHLRTKNDIITYYYEVYGDQAFEKMLETVPLDTRRRTAAATEISNDSTDRLLGFILEFGEPEIIDQNGPVALKYASLAKVVQDTFEQDDLDLTQDEPDEP